MQTETENLSRIFTQVSLEEKLDSIKKLSQSSTNESLSRLLDFSYDRDEFVREAVAKSLLYRKEDDSTLSSLLRLLKDEDRDVRKAALKALKQHRGLSSNKIIYYLEKEKDIRTREKIISLFEILKDKISINYLLSLLTHKNYEIREKAVTSLINIGSSHFILPLLKTLNSLTFDTKIKLIKFLGKFNNKESVKPLIELLMDREPKIRYYSAFSLGEIGDEKAIDGLIYTLKKDPVQEVRAACASALLKIGTIKALEPVLNFFENVESSLLLSFGNFNLFQIFEEVLKNHPISSTPEEIELFRRIKIKLSRYDREIRTLAEKKLSLLMENSPKDIIIISCNDRKKPGRNSIEIIKDIY